MPARARRLACFLLLLLALPVAAQAARLALVIGNDSYASVVPLKNARNDARLMAGLLRDAGYDVTIVEDSTNERLLSAVASFARRVGRDDEVLFYFAGHGVQIGESQLLLPIDVDTGSTVLVEQTSLPLDRVRELLRSAQTVLLVINVSRDSPFDRRRAR